MKASIVAEPNSVATRANGPATANIWLLIAGREFPMRGWNDFIVVVLSWWAVALVRILRNESQVQLVNFMDGPYAVEISRPSLETLRLRALEGPDRTREMGVDDASLKDFSQTLIAQAREVLAVCKRQAWWSPDATKLESSLLDLERECLRAFGSN